MKKSKKLSYDSALDFVDQHDIRKFDTDLGSLAYLDIGSGSPVLFFHGVIGGLETVFNFFDSNDLEQYRIISISRPGYRFSENFNANVDEITNFYLELLDSLEIDKVNVNAWSAGCFFAHHLVQKHPERILKTVMINPILPGYRRWFSFVGPFLVSKNTYNFFDLLSKNFPPAYIVLFSLITGADLITITKNQQLNNKVMGFLEVAKPLESWVFGTKNEMKMIRRSSRMDMNDFNNAKILVSKTDRIAGVKKNFKRYNFQQANYESFDKGGHFMAILYKEEIDKIIRDFMEK